MKKFVILVLCFMMLMPAMANAGFNDVASNHWAASYIDELASKGIINGIGNGNFAPDATLTRGQFIKLIVVASLPEINFANRVGLFNHWAASYVEVAENYMVLENGEVNLENIDEPITRIEVVQILTLCDIEIRKNNQESKAIMPFNDIEELSVKESILLEHAVARGVIGGYPDGTFRPNNNLTRAEASKIISIYMGL